MTWTEPGAYPVAPGVHRIPLPLPDDGLKAVNVYTLETSDGMVLIDGGWAIPQAREVLIAGLAQLGAQLGDVRRFLVTHAHRDHYTQAVVLRRETGAAVGLGVGERDTLERMRTPGAHPVQVHVGLLRRLGAGPLADSTERLLADHPFDRDEWELPDAWLLAGDIPLPGGRVLEAVPTPGHTVGHLVFHDLAAGLLFAGDHVLPTITPSIGFEPALSADPLGAFLRSLALVRRRPDAVLLPAHGEVRESVHARVDELVAHHGQRLDDVQAAAEGTGDPAAQVATRLLWTRHGRTFDELNGFNAMLAIFETGAHLELLAIQGRLVREDTEGVLRYR